jgi:beta-phosphoglucomutase
MTVYKGILFDFDGTLADTMEGHYLAWKVVLAERGIAIEADDYYPLEGAGLHEIARKFTEGHGLTDAALEDLVRRKKGEYVGRQRPIAFYPGVDSLVAGLKQRGVPLAIVTAGHLDQLKATVPDVFLRQFDCLVTGDQLTRGKPDAEPYVKAASELALKPEECIAVENAPLGVTSAKLAHTYCIAVCSTVDRSRLSDADEIWPAFSDLTRSAAIQSLLSTESHAGI